jgi:hypothetical protein
MAISIRPHFEGGGRIETLINEDILQPLYFLIPIIASIALKENMLSKLLRKVKPSKLRDF